MKLEKENLILPPSTGGSVLKNPPTNAGDMDLIPESGNGNLEKEMATLSSVLAWRIPLYLYICILIFGKTNTIM